MQRLGILLLLLNTQKKKSFPPWDLKILSKFNLPKIVRNTNKVYTHKNSCLAGCTAVTTRICLSTINYDEMPV